jgi:hypothetical protein
MAAGAAWRRTGSRWRLTRRRQAGTSGPDEGAGQMHWHWTTYRRLTGLGWQASSATYVGVNRPFLGADLDSDD